MGWRQLKDALKPAWILDSWISNVVLFPALFPGLIFDTTLLVHGLTGQFAPCPRSEPLILCKGCHNQKKTGSAAYDALSHVDQQNQDPPCDPALPR